MLPYYGMNLPEVKTIVESIQGSVILVTQAKVSWQATGLTTQLRKIKEQYECLIKLVETMENTPSKKPSK